MDCSAIASPHCTAASAGSDTQNESAPFITPSLFPVPYTYRKAPKGWTPLSFPQLPRYDLQKHILFFPRFHIGIILHCHASVIIIIDCFYHESILRLEHLTHLGGVKKFPRPALVTFFHVETDIMVLFFIQTHLLIRRKPLLSACAAFI